MANPSPVDGTANLKPFEKGQSGNPGGKTKAQRAAEVRAAEDSAVLRAMMTKALLEKVKAGDDISEFIDPATLKLFKDSEDRAHGTPKTTTEMSGPEGGPIPVSEVLYKIHDPKPDED